MGILSAIRAALQALKHRGEDFDSHADQAMRFVGRASVPLLPEVPQGTGERMARDIEAWLRKESSHG